MLDEYLCLGGNELANNARTYGYAVSADCPVSWFRCEPCPGLHDALGDWVPAQYRDVLVEGEIVSVLAEPGYSESLPYTSDNVKDAPWYDPSNADLTSRFYGVYIISMDGMSDSTRTATVTEGVLDGGVVGLSRHATREVRVRALLVADGEDALEYGLAWLNTALEATDCSQHAGACGAADLSFFAFCPPAPDPESADVSDWEEQVTLSSRYLHQVTVTSGALVEQKLVSSNKRTNGYIVEWTMVAGSPWVFSETREIPWPAVVPIVVQDIPFNLVPVPSAELRSGTVVTATNYATNPSVETNTTGWGNSSTAVTGVAASRSTVVAAAGTASYLVQMTATGAGSNGEMNAYQDVSLTGMPAGARPSFSVWSAALVASGSPSLDSLNAYVQWRNGSTVLGTSTLGATTTEYSGRVFSAQSLTPPVGATTARVLTNVKLNSWASGNVVRLFTDALAVTVP